MCDISKVVGSSLDPTPLSPKRVESPVTPELGRGKRFRIQTLKGKEFSSSLTSHSESKYFFNFIHKICRNTIGFHYIQFRENDNDFVFLGQCVSAEAIPAFVPRALDFGDSDVDNLETESDTDDNDIDNSTDKSWKPEPRARKSKTQKCMFPNTAAFAARRNSGNTEFTMWVNFVCMDLMPFFPDIGKKHASKTYNPFGLNASCLWESLTTS